MYIQITEKCNMRCAHCMYACTSRGRHMGVKTFKRALAHAVSRGDYVTLGGGEPTLHPRFWEFLALALAAEFAVGIEGLFLVTNGSQTNTALALAKLARRGVLGCALSRDEWHDPIDSRVVDAFSRPRRQPAYGDPADMDLREIRTVDVLVNQGRCDFGTQEECDCDGSPFINPDGRVRHCGCLDAPVVGNVFDGFEDQDPNKEWRCHHTFAREEANV